MNQQSLTPNIGGDETALNTPTPSPPDVHNSDQSPKMAHTSRVPESCLPAHVSPFTITTEVMPNSPLTAPSHSSSAQTWSLVERDITSCCAHDQQSCRQDSRDPLEELKQQLIAHSETAQEYASYVRNYEQALERKESR
jgi:hypothetical protein